MEAVMRIACSFLLSLFLAVNVLAQSALTINKVNRKELTATAPEVAFSTVLEGTIDDPTLAVYLIVRESGNNAWRSYPATVADQKPEPSGKYKWYAICQFGEVDGRGVGNSYQVRAIAVDRKQLGKKMISDFLETGSPQSRTITIKRVKK